MDSATCISNAAASMSCGDYAANTCNDAGFGNSVLYTSCCDPGLAGSQAFGPTGVDCVSINIKDFAACSDPSQIPSCCCVAGPPYSLPTQGLKDHGMLHKCQP